MTSHSSVLREGTFLYDTCTTTVVKSCLHIFFGGQVVTTNAEALTRSRFARHYAALAAIVGTQAGKCSVRDGKDVWRQRISTDHTAVLTHHLQNTWPVRLHHSFLTPYEAAQK